MKICIRCQGKGSYMGLGMIIVDCTLCDDEKYGKADSLPSLDRIDRRSKSYQKAIKEIMQVNPEISRKDAEKLFDDAYTNS